MANLTPSTSTTRDLQRQQIPLGMLSPRTGTRGGFDPFLGTRDIFTTSPFSLMRRMTEEMDRIFADAGARQWQGDAPDWVPAVEVAERDNKYIVRAEIPGLKPEDVDVEINGNELILQGERKYEREEDRGGVRRTERSYGRFYRAIPLPDEINPEQIKASCENGILEVTIPMSQKQTNNRHIPVQSASASGGSTSGARPH